LPITDAYIFALLKTCLRDSAFFASVCRPHSTTTASTLICSQPVICLQRRAVYWDDCTAVCILRPTCSRRAAHRKKQDREFALISQTK